MYVCMYIQLSLSVSPMNASEFLRVKDASQTLFNLALFASKVLGLRIPDQESFAQNLRPPDQDTSTSFNEAVEPNLSSHASASMLVDVMKAFVAVAHVESGRLSLLGLCPQFAVVMTMLLSFSTYATAGAVQADCIEIISRCCEEKQLQIIFVQAGTCTTNTITTTTAITTTTTITTTSTHSHYYYCYYYHYYHYYHCTTKN